MQIPPNLYFDVCMFVDQNGNNWKPRTSVASVGIHQGTSSIHEHNVTYTMKGTGSGAGFQAIPGRIETNFSGADTLSQDIFSNLLTSGPAPIQLGPRPKSQQQQSNTSGGSATSSSRFSIGSNHSGYHYSSTSTRASAAGGRGTPRKSISRNTKPWK